MAVCIILMQKAEVMLPISNNKSKFNKFILVHVCDLASLFSYDNVQVLHLS
jgi:hypothetical protein